MPSAPANSQASTVPLCVDLDGTLIRTDVLWVSMRLLLKRNPFYLFLIGGWFLRGRALMKMKIAERVELNAALLPYHQPFFEYLKSEKSQGRMLVLATAADFRLAKTVADHVGLFDEVVASDGKTNQRGRNKGHTLSAKFGRKNFDYAGNSTVDLPVWEQSRCAIVVNADESLVARARRIAEVSLVFP
ncbi:MAG TPA: haloacid dehalogenase-like hydrolase [Verrucomicrobiae bacterium]|jgi:phosphoserine phosphatase|nr:haloacid dehalogenase-like hydrolase [Verrucomicrobiae bacterium]